MVAIAADEPGWVIQKNKFEAGETLQVLAPNCVPYEITLGELWDEKGEPIVSAPHAQMKVKIGIDLPANAIIRRVKDEK